MVSLLYIYLVVWLVCLLVIYLGSWLFI